jgi:O-acetyl-ADP-ribose deacetylase (regulator of RNase III)
MREIQYRTGDATAPESAGNKLICHVCNDVGGWGGGFVLALSKRWDTPERAYRAWHKHRGRNDFALGALLLVQVDPDTWVANLVAQHGTSAQGGRPPIRYDALESALAKLAAEAKRLKASVHMPRIGCGLAGGTWEQVEPIITRTLAEKDIEVWVYDLQ